MEEYIPKPGDHVFIRRSTDEKHSKFDFHWDGIMGNWLGTIQIIRNIGLDKIGYHVEFESTPGSRINQWFWRPDIHFEKLRSRVLKFNLWKNLNQR